MDILVGVLLAAQQATFGVLGVVVSLNHRRIRYAFFFGALALIGIGLTVWQAVLAHQSGEAATKSLLGDAERPPFVSVISLPGNTRFVTTNSSDYPAYGTHIQLDDDTNRTSIRTFDYPEIAAHLAMLDNKPWAPTDGQPEHHFTAQITTRTGLVFEEMILRHTSNDQWMSALRVRQGMRTLEEDVDSSWPRNDKGQVEWN